jgi:GR25 family glycosyltransferase involved in LPS biosynthesis
MEHMRLEHLNFDAVFCINLDRRPDRRRQAQEQFNYLGLTPTFYSAIDINPFQIDTSGNFKKGMLGCYLSHLSILQHCILSGYERVLITEDDLSAITGCNALLQHALPVIPDDWEFAYLGYSVFPDQQSKNKPVNKFWCIPAGCWGTQAYMLNGKQTIETLFNALKKPKAQIDIDLSYTILPNSGLKYYGITPSAIRQSKGRSDVQ